MPTFNFQAKTVAGKFVKGEVEATSETEARVKIRAQQLMPLKLVPKSDKKAKTGSGLFKDSVSTKELQVFTRQFAVLIAAGVPVVQSLQALTLSTRSGGMVRAIQTIISEVERGKRLGDALETQPHVFDRMYVNLVKAGEEGGVLETILNRLAEYIEKSVKLRGKITGALWYPAAIIGVAILVVAGIMVFVIPSFVKVFATSRVELPALTKMVVALSHGCVQYWYFILLGLVIAPLSVRAYYKTPDGKKTMDPYMLKLPVLGGLIQKGSVARMCRTMATLLAAGVGILDALEIAGNTSGNYVIELAMNACRESVSKGRSLAEPLRKAKVIPTMAVEMISIGEQTGNLDQMLGKVADFYEDEVDVAADALSSLIEPLLLVFLGGVIGVIVIAMYLPIFNMASAVGG